jgi:hypothetical protein
MHLCCCSHRLQCPSYPADGPQRGVGAVAYQGPWTGPRVCSAEDGIVVPTARPQLLRYQQPCPLASALQAAPGSPLRIGVEARNGVYEMKRSWRLIWLAE